MHTKIITKHFIKYMVPGVLTFGIDLALLWLFMENFEMHYLPAAALAFTIGTTINYFAARIYVFFGTERELHTGYVYFMVFAAIGIALTTGIMALFVEIYSLDAVIARILTAAIVGIWNFLANYFVNFKMHHVHNRSIPSRKTRLKSRAI